MERFETLFFLELDCDIAAVTRDAGEAEDWHQNGMGYAVRKVEYLPDDGYRICRMDDTDFEVLCMQWCNREHYRLMRYLARLFQYRDL